MSGGRQTDYGLLTGGGGGGDALPCGQLTIDAQLHSLTDHANEVALDDVLGVEVEPNALRVVVVDDSGRTIGAIATQVPQLLDCLRAGVAFIATVTTADSGDVRVRVTAA